MPELWGISEYPFIATTPGFTLAQSDSTWEGLWGLKVFRRSVAKGKAVLP